MATYDLDQQEQLDQIKHFWKQYGNLITWLLVLVMGAFAAWRGYEYLAQKKATDAATLYETLDSAAMANNPDKVALAFKDLKDNYAGTTFAEQGALLAARTAAERQKPEEAKATLQWLVENGKNENLVAVARLRLAGVFLDAKDYSQALKALDGDIPEEFAPLVADRKGDILLAQGKKDEAAKAYLVAWKGLSAEQEYRRFIDGKLTALGQPPEPAGKGALPVVPGGFGAQGLPPGMSLAN